MSGRFWQVMLGLLLLLIGLSSVFGDQAITLTLGLLGFYLITRQFNRSSAQISARDARRRAERPRQTDHPRHVEEDIRVDARIIPESGGIVRDADALPHAVAAARLAGIEPRDALVVPVDIGVMAFGEDGEPMLHRTVAVDEDSSAIQPYIHLRLPRRAEGRIRFELIDAAGAVAFVHEDRYPLRAGINLISPRARLPITPQFSLRGDWELRVYADNVPLAVHRFGWREDGGKAIRRQLAEDGEISPELRALMAQQRLDTLSLDELLGDQPSDTDNAANLRRAGR